jgi:hypothetical protein
MSAINFSPTFPLLSRIPSKRISCLHHWAPSAKSFSIYHQEHHRYHCWRHVVWPYKRIRQQWERWCGRSCFTAVKLNLML